MAGGREGDIIVIAVEAAHREPKSVVVYQFCNTVSRILSGVFGLLSTLLLSHHHGRALV
jgi:hypothetical protein